MGNGFNICTYSKKMEKAYLSRQKSGEKVDDILKDFLTQEIYQKDPIALVKIASL